MSTVTLDPQKFELKPYKSLSNEELSERIEAVRKELGSKLLILGHHYQQDEVIRHADLTGDSYQLSQLAASSRDCRYIVFCGVHFMFHNPGAPMPGLKFRIVPVETGS